MKSSSPGIAQGGRPGPAPDLPCRERSEPGEDLRPSARFILSLLGEHDVDPHPGLAAALGELDWQSFSEAVSALAATIPRLIAPADMSRTFARHAQTEAAGAEVIGHVAGTLVDGTHRLAMKRHAADERRHCRIFGGLIQLLSGEAAAGGVTAAADRDPFVEGYDGDFAGFLCDTHFAEVRNIFYLDVLRRRVSHPEPSIQRKVVAALSRIILDERRHVVSTASILSELFPEDVHMVARLRAAFEAYVLFIKEEAARAGSVH
jgi:hypothetical protein